MNEREQENPAAALYVDETTHRFSVLGVEIQFREISGQEYMDIIDQCAMVRGTETKLNRSLYSALLIEKCVLAPKIDPRKLKPAALALLVAELEGRLGLTEVAQKNLPRL